jgi:hypothetical protein
MLARDTLKFVNYGRKKVLIGLRSPCTKNNLKKFVKSFVVFNPEIYADTIKKNE